MKPKMDIWGIALAVGVGVVTGLVYMTGKASGKGEAYVEFENCLKEAIKEAKVEND